MISDYKIRDEFIVKNLKDKDFFPLFKKYHNDVFPNDHSLHFRKFLTPHECEKIDVLGKNCYNKLFTMNLAVYDKNKDFVGWSFGWQESSTTYYMCNSGVLSNFRRKGIYSSLLETKIKVLSEMGFQLIYSRHNATNNNVLIPKLKAGFVISKMEISDTFGCLVHLHYFTNKTRQKLMDYRSGKTKPDQELKDLLRL